MNISESIACTRLIKNVLNVETKLFDVYYNDPTLDELVCKF